MKKDDLIAYCIIAGCLLSCVLLGDMIGSCRSQKCPAAISAEEIEKRVLAEAARMTDERDNVARLFGVDIPDFPLGNPDACVQGVDSGKNAGAKVSDFSDAFIEYDAGEVFSIWRWARDYSYSDYRMAIKLSPRVIMHVYGYRTPKTGEKATFYSAKLCDVRDIKCVNEIANEFVGD